LILMPLIFHNLTRHSPSNDPFWFLTARFGFLATFVIVIQTRRLLTFSFPSFFASIPSFFRPRAFRGVKAGPRLIPCCAYLPKGDVLFWQVPFKTHQVLCLPFPGLRSPCFSPLPLLLSFELQFPYFDSLPLFLLLFRPCSFAFR